MNGAQSTPANSPPPGLDCPNVRSALPAPLVTTRYAAAPPSRRRRSHVLPPPPQSANRTLHAAPPSDLRAAHAATPATSRLVVPPAPASPTTRENSRSSINARPPARVSAFAPAALVDAPPHPSGRQRKPESRERCRVYAAPRFRLARASHCAAPCRARRVSRESAGSRARAAPDNDVAPSALVRSTTTSPKRPSWNVDASPASSVSPTTPACESHQGSDAFLASHSHPMS
ncbi:hypothetical protein B0H15DRAFT_956678 [Mycena belliarum]|uniref:Uncharacterized protein n=1 Tax=Mycena belliarum TaxID=1033014 RepID=A0AAD6XM92_9AGAR|nr:hypothetical protein B0H15DRAFT_956678 [Mycena belliae]